MCTLRPGETCLEPTSEQQSEEAVEEAQEEISGEEGEPEGAAAAEGGRGVEVAAGWKFILASANNLCSIL